MKKIIILLMCLLIALSMCSCGEKETESKTDEQQQVTPVTDDKKEETNPTTEEKTDDVKTDDVKTDDGGDTEEIIPVNSEPVTALFSEKDGVYTVAFSEMPKCAAQLADLDITNEYVAGAVLVCALANFEDNYDNALEMLDYIMGPETPSAYDENFIKNQVDQYPYVMRSYFAGSSPENDYKYDSVTVELTENIYSRDEDGYVKLWVQSSGADSERSFTLRQKGSTGEWFLFSDTYKGLMAGIREPKSADPWA